MWNRMSSMFQIFNQFDDINNPNLYINLNGVQIFDSNRMGFVECKRIIRNVSNNWVDLNMSNGRRLVCTDNYPLDVVGKGNL